MLIPKFTGPNLVPSFWAGSLGFWMGDSQFSDTSTCIVTDIFNLACASILYSFLDFYLTPAPNTHTHTCPVPVFLTSIWHHHSVQELMSLLRFLQPFHMKPLKKREAESPSRISGHHLLATAWCPWEPVVSLGPQQRLRFTVYMTPSLWSPQISA